jgi:hypothetical protein
MIDISMDDVIGSRVLRGYVGKNFVKKDSKHKNGSCIVAIVYVTDTDSISRTERERDKKRWDVIVQCRN